MKQILQDLSNGATIIAEAPAPSVSSGKLIVESTVSLISAGTERMLVGFGKASYIEKARQQPEKVRMVLDKIGTDGFLTTMDAVRSKLSQPIPLGYCNVGVVSAVGSENSRFRVGDRVVSNGVHADIVKVPENLCAKLPDSVDDESASFVVVSSIGLQGLRLAQPTLGESFVVIGVGLIGLLTVQLLRAHGCNVLSIDFDDSKLQIAQQFGSQICNPAKGEDPVAAGMAFSRGKGVDGVIITASTKSNEPITQAARMSRKRGRIVLVGVAGLELNRADFYEKEITLQVSCSYGPGRYDLNYEENGQDYPFGFVRWTEQRNFEAVIDLLASRKLDVKPLISRRFDFEKAPEAYEMLMTDNSALGILLQYKDIPDERHKKTVPLNEGFEFEKKKPLLGFIGCGNYASRILIPAFKRAGGQFHTIVTASGISGAIHGEKTGFSQASTDLDAMLANPTINTVVIVSRHDSHAPFVKKAIASGKHVFVEKPLCLTLDELREIEAAYQQHAVANGIQQIITVGFNRRFSPHVQMIKKLLQAVQEPKSFIVTINAGKIPSDHWTQNLKVGGGRIIGEACHFIDLMRYMAGAAIISVQARRMGENPVIPLTEDKATITLGFADGSFGSIHYLSNGAASFPKERIEIFTSGRILQLDNFLRLKGFGWPGFRKMNLWRQDKGQNACAAAFLNAIEQDRSLPIPIEEVFEVARITIEAAQILRQQ